jgi:hypothetical protein
VTSSSPDPIHFSLLKSKETQKTLIRSRLWFFTIYLMIFRRFPKKNCSALNRSTVFPPFFECQRNFFCTKLYWFF